MIKIAFSFDDGRKDNYRVAKDVLKPLNMKASFNITTGYILNCISDNDKPSDHEAMSIEELKELYGSDLFEIAGHGFVHNNNQDNLIKGNIELKKILNDSDKIVGVVSPHSEFDLHSISQFQKKCEKNDISYLRISYNFPNFCIIVKILRKINRFLKSPKLFSMIYKNSYVSENSSFLVYSVGVIKDNSFEEIKCLIDNAIKLNRNYVLMFHSILKPGEKYYDDLFTWDYDNFKRLCDYLNMLREKNVVEICHVKDLIKKG